jgi:hypothetical protein
MRRVVVPTNEEEMRIVFDAVGRTVVIWALLEQMITLAATLCYHALGIKHPKGAHRKSLEAKVAYLRACLRDKVVLADYRDRGLALLDRVETLSETRHAMVHGATNKFLQGSGGVRFTRVFRIGNDDRLTVVDTDIAFDQLGGTVNQVVKLAMDFGALTVDLRTRFLPKTP